MYSKFLDKTVWIVERLLMILFGASIFITTLQIVFRYIIGSPLNWSEQIARCIFIWLAMLSVPMIMRKKGAIAFDLLVGFLPAKIKEFVAIVVQLLILFFAVYYFMFSLELCIETGSRLMAGVKIPQNSIYVVAPLAMLILILVTFEQIIKSVRQLKGGEV